MTDKVRENRLRRVAERRGMQLVKSRRRDPGSLGFGTYGLIDPYLNTWVFSDGHDGYGLSLDEIEHYLRPRHAGDAPHTVTYVLNGEECTVETKDSSDSLRVANGALSRGAPECLVVGNGYRFRLMPGNGISPA